MRAEEMITMTTSDPTAFYWRDPVLPTRDEREAAIAEQAEDAIRRFSKASEVNWPEAVILREVDGV
jgi:hypothetical protein